MKLSGIIGEVETCLDVTLFFVCDSIRIFKRLYLKNRWYLRNEIWRDDSWRPKLSKKIIFIFMWQHQILKQLYLKNRSYLRNETLWNEFRSPKLPIKHINFFVTASHLSIFISKNISKTIDNWIWKFCMKVN